MNSQTIAAIVSDCTDLADDVIIDQGRCHALEAMRAHGALVDESTLTTEVIRNFTWNVGDKAIVVPRVVRFVAQAEKGGLMADPNPAQHWNNTTVTM